MVGHWNRLYLAYTPTRKRSGIIVAESSFIHVRMGRERDRMRATVRIKLFFQLMLLLLHIAPAVTRLETISPRLCMYILILEA